MSGNRASILIVLALCTTSTTILADLPRRPDERERLVQYLDRTGGLFLESVEGLTDAQWSYKPAPDRWSIAEIAQHIALAETYLRDVVNEILGEAPPIVVTDGSLRKEDEVMKLIIDRTERLQAPRELWPGDRWKTPAESLSAFRKERAHTVKLVQEAPDLRGYGADHPIVGPLDAYGWIVYLSGHTERHTLQIREVMAHPGFPRTPTR